MAASGKRVAVIGAGRVGSTLGARLLAAGWLVQYGSRRPGHSRKLADALRRQEGAQGGSISAAVEWASHGSSGGAIILAVPGSALASDAACAEFARSLGPCAGGQVILDATNPLDADSCSLAWQRGRSSAEALAECLPEAFVYKAFNTVGVEHMAAPDGSRVTGQRLTLMFAGPAERQADAAAVIEAVGFQPEWVGHVRYARNLEALAELYIHLGAGLGGADWSAADGTRPFHFAVLRRRREGGHM